MTISEVITHCEKVADELLRQSDAYKVERKKKKNPYEREYCTLESKRSLVRRAEYLQTAEWLKDYKLLLEQEPILGKIKAEIANLADADAYGDYQQGFNFGLMRAVQIIDKYKAERIGE